jgi:hypothetical protein
MNRPTKKWMKVISALAIISLTSTYLGFQALAASVYHSYLPVVFKPNPPTPTPTSPPPSKGVYVLSNHSFYVTSWGSLHIVGEVINDTDDHVSWLEISANLFDSNGQLLDTELTFAALNNLAKGDKTCFDLIFLAPPTGWSSYQFENPTYSTGGEPLLDMVVFNDSGRYIPDYGEYEIIGQVRNDNSTRVEYVTPIGTLYDASGKVIGCDYSAVNATDLDPGQVSGFKITYYGRDYVDVRSYRLQVDGYLP